METKIFSPLDNFMNFWRWFDTRPPQFSSFNVRGDMVSIYLPVDEMLYYANLLQSRGYSDNLHDNIWTYRGYAKGGNYFKIGPYHVRIAQHREKIHNQQDVKYIQEQYQDQVAELKRQNAELQNIITNAKEALTK